MIAFTVTETALPTARVERDDFADEPPREEPRAPRRPPYHRASQRELVRASLDAHMHTHGYDREIR